MNTSRIIILFCSLYLITHTVSGQYDSFRLLGGKKKIEIPFEYKANYIVVKVRLNDLVPIKLIFDTGAQNTILFHQIYSSILDQKTDRKIKIQGSDLGSYIEGNIYRNVLFSLEEKYFQNKDLIILDDRQGLLESSLGQQIDGIMGSNFFRGMVVKIDYVKEKIIFSHPNFFTAPSDYQEIPIKLKNHKPYLETRLKSVHRDTLNTELLLDTGAPISFILHSNADSTLGLPRDLPSGILAYGIGGPIYGFLGKVESLWFGQEKFDDLFTNFQELDSTLLFTESNFRHGLVGNLVLEKFNIIIDYSKSKCYVKKNKYYNKEIKYDKSGITLFAYGKNFREYRIRYVRKNSPADQAGLMQGDKIHKIGLWSTRWYSLEKIANKFKGKEGTRIKLTIERGGQKLKKIITLQDPLREYYNFEKIPGSESSLYSIN